MRIKIDRKNSELIDHLTSMFNFKNDGITARLAFSYSLQTNRKFGIHDDSQLGSDGKDLRDDRALFGISTDEKSYFILYKTLLDQHYQRNLNEEQFIRLFKSHLNHGLEKINEELKDKNIASGFHISFLMNVIKKSMDLIAEGSPFSYNESAKRELKAYEGVISLNLGFDEEGNAKILRINDLNEFDSCNIAIAGMVGSGKTELVKDLLFQIATQTNNELKFIFFDYKGEGNPERLKPFFDKTGCQMVDLRNAPFNLNPLSFINLNNERAKSFNIKSFVDFVCTIATQLGASQKHLLQNVIIDAYEEINSKSTISSKSQAHLRHPTLLTVLESLNKYNKENGRSPDTLDAIISDLANNIFQTETGFDEELRIYEQSLYINLPLELSDTLRQLCVFLTLKYLLAEFSSTNDTEPTNERIKPLRYVIVVDEAHVYLKNKNASKALEDILRVLRSKGVVIIMLTQGVEDYKTKNFDFASQIKIPICLNINNKDYKIIESFVGTPKSKQRLQEVIGKLEPRKGIINISEPVIIKVNQFWHTMEKLDYRP